VPRVTIPVTRLSDAGSADPTETNGDPINQHALPNSGRTVLRVRNAGAAALDLTLVTPVTVGGRAVEDTVVSIPAGDTRTFASLSPALYGTSVPIDVESADLKLMAFEP
jgi:mRNA-degrading endonuclease toxin of MazEF toxin-antitoxin module